MDGQKEDKAYIFHAELTGVRKEEVNLSLEDGRLRIDVLRDEEKEEKNKNYIHKERRYRSIASNIFFKKRTVKE